MAGRPVSGPSGAWSGTFALTVVPGAVHAGPMDGAGPRAVRGEFTRLSRRESLRLLGTVPVGRLIFTVNALPTVRLMNFAVVDDLIVLRTAAGSTVARKVNDMIVAFEADEFDAAARSGWSVTVTGRAALVAGPEVVARYWTVPLMPWAPGVRDQFVTISTELIEGQRVRRPPAAADGEAAITTPTAPG